MERAALGDVGRGSRSSLDEGLDLGGQIGRGRHRGDLVGDPSGGLTV